MAHPMNIKIQHALPFFCLWLIGMTGFAADAVAVPGTSVVLTENRIDGYETQIENRIRNVVSIVSPKYTGAVKSYLRTYIQNNPEGTAQMLGRAQLYFPIFEKLLAESGLPTDLKYLAITESALNPLATSRSGAVGLWQFMKPTGREYGLRVSSYVDERRDPVKSTEAAVKYLKYLYNRFGSWELALAAYNSGPGRVNSAIRRSGTRNYWKLMRYLPRETRSYVPGFIAATYLMHHYADHGLAPKYPHEDFQYTSSVKIYEPISFADINKVTGVPFAHIRTLNPVFTRNYIPKSVFGYSLMLPQYVMPLMLQYLNRPDQEEIITEHYLLKNPDARFEERMTEYSYVVVSGDNLTRIANRHDCSIAELRNWNNIPGSMLRPGQRLKIYRKERVLIAAPVVEKPVQRSLVELAALEVAVPGPIIGAMGVDQMSFIRPALSTGMPEGRILTLRKREGLRQVQQRYNLKVPVVSSDRPVVPGRVLSVQ